MTKAKPVVPGTIYLLTRRCLGRCFFLAPSSAVNATFGFLMGEALEKYGIELLAAVQMPNHYHAVVHDVRGVLPKFLQRFHGFTARSVNRVRGRVDTFWDGQGSSAVELGNAETVERELVYVLCNPVKAGLVATVKEWPGLVTSARGCVEGGKVFARPKGFFQKEGAMPEAAALKVHVPPTHAHMTPLAFAAHLEALVKKREEAIRVELEASGRRFGTARMALKTPWREAPKTDKPRSRLKPKVAAGDKKERCAMLERRALFEEAYELAYAAFRSGKRDVVFPGGTWKMAAVHGANAAAPPPPSWR